MMYAPLLAALLFSADASWDYAVVPIAFFSPETSVAMGAGSFIYQNRPRRAGGPRRDDSLALVVIGTLRQQFVVGLEGTKYLQGGRVRLGGELVATHYPTRFWGLGNDTPEPYDRYTPSRVATSLSLGLRILDEIYLGVVGGVGVFRASGYEPGGLVAQHFARHDPQGQLVSLGAYLQRDTRDDAVGPRSGSLTTLTATVAPAALGGSHAHSKVELDQRNYLGTGLDGVLALQLHGEMVVGNVPLGETPALGGSSLLRGFYQGRYRDRLYLMAQAEWRVPLVWRLALAPFAAAGDVFPSLDAISVDRLKVAGGLGLRFRLKQDRPLNLRVDLAHSPTGTSVYVNLREAF